VPWEEPQLVAAYLRPDPPGWVDRLRQAVRAARTFGTPAPTLNELEAEPLKRES